MGEMSILALVFSVALLVFGYGDCRLDPKIDATQVHEPGDGHDPPHSHFHFNVDDDDDDEDHDEHDGEEFNGDEEEDDNERMTSYRWSLMEPDQQSLILDKFFHQLDSNSDNYVSEDEMLAYVERNMERENQEISREEFKLLDYKDSDGVLSWSEYNGEDEEEDPNDPTVVLERFRFDSADVDHSGTLTVSEFEAFYIPYDHEHMKEYLLRKVMSEYDKDNDKKLDKYEFMDIATDHEDFYENEEAFAAFDANKDEHLDEEELYQLLSHSGTRLAKQEVQWVVDKMTIPTYNGMWARDDIGANVEIFLDNAVLGDQLMKYHEEL